MTDTPPLSWKEQQRLLTRRARLDYVHSKEARSKPGQVLRFRNGAAVQVQTDGSVRRVTVHQEPQAQL